MSEQNEIFLRVATEFIQNQMVVLGNHIALDLATKVTGIKVSEQGEVLSFSADANLVLKNLLEEYEKLSGEVAKSSFYKILEKYPELKIA